MTNEQTKTVEQIKAEYTHKEKSKVDELKALDRKVKRPAEIFTYIFGVGGSLVLGTGMCLAMEVIGGSMALGVAIGVVGLAMVSVNYFFYKAILKGRKKKYAKQIIELSDNLLNK